MDKTATKVTFLNPFIILIWCMIIITSCDSDDVGEFYTTFTEEMMGGYLQKRPKEFSEFTTLLDTTGVLSLLNAYGKYTCFAPNNQALKNFYFKKGKQSIRDFSIDTLKKIAYDHIINGMIIPIEELRNGRLSKKSMSDRYISTAFSNSNDGKLLILVNNSAPIASRDIEVHNGIIHEITEVLDPIELNIFEALAADPKFSLFVKALIATDLDKELVLTQDASFNPDNYLIDVSAANVRTPKARKYGFTALVESDSTYAEYGISTLDDLKKYASNIYNQTYPDDAEITDITDRRNSLNRFIAYHLINKQISFTRFVMDYDNTGHSIKTYDMYEYIEPMCPNTLIEVRTNRATSETNLFNMKKTTDNAIRIVSDNYDNDATNGVYHEIDKILAYTNDFISDISSKRLRMDAASFFPEFTNNNIRGKVYSSSINSELWKFPPEYIDRLTTSEGTEFGYFNADDRYLDYQGDEVYLKGLYDFEIITPVVPAGTYEVRFGWKVETKRGVAQLYWDNLPCGIPLDLRIFATDPKIGYELPGSNPDDPYGYENDKMMRNRGYMKGPACFQAANTSWFTGNARINSGYLRRVLGIFTFDEAGTHKFGVKAAHEGEFMFDFLEFIPVEMLQYEDID
ncbi:MAG: fasciclin domain-containing protein [Marinilabiliaceae bacterium]|nr:fasciclin domain-containing protein [Marinilabiliaceae bacterium]